MENTKSSTGSQNTVRRGPHSLPFPLRAPGEEGERSSTGRQRTCHDGRGHLLVGPRAHDLGGRGCGRRREDHGAALPLLHLELVVEREAVLAPSCTWEVKNSSEVNGDHELRRSLQTEMEMETAVNVGQKKNLRRQNCHSPAWCCCC